MFCSKCGTKVNDNAKFCGSCGNVIAASVQPAAQAVPQPVPAPQPAPAYQQPTPQPAPIPQPAPVPQPAPAVYQQPTPQPAPVYQQPTPQPAPVYQQPTPQPLPVYQQPTPQAAPVASASPMKFKVFGGNLPGVTISLNAGESIFTQSGGMVWMDNGINMTTNMQGGIMKGLGRMISGDSLFMATYTSTMQNQEITIASTFPGSIAAIELKGNSIIAQKSAFLCAQLSVALSIFMTKSIGSGLFGGEGFILQKMTGYGHLFLEIDGSLVERTLAPGQKLKVDTGNVAAFEETVTYQAEMVKGFKNILFGGEGLFLTTLTGPGKVWLQTMTLPGFAKQLIPFLPKPGSN